MGKRKILLLIILNCVLCILDGFLTHIVQTPLDFKLEANPFIKSNEDLIISRIFFFTLSVPCFYSFYKSEVNGELRGLRRFFVYFALLFGVCGFLFGVITNLIALVMLWSLGII